MIHVVGLGPGDPASLPPRAFSLLSSGLPVLLRTARHPTVEQGPLAEALARGVPVIPLDDAYEQGATFEETYRAIVGRVLAAEAEQGEVVYAVPGSPLIGESTVALLLAEAKARGVRVEVVPAP